MHWHRILPRGAKCEAKFLVNRQRPCELFEKHFAKQAVRTRSDGQPDSPFVRFVTAVTAELGEPVVAETVSKAMSAVAKVKTND